MMRQKTLAQPVEISGVGLHTGFPSRMRLEPAPVDTGIVFRRSDLNNFRIPAVKQFVSKVSYCTSLMKQGVLIATVEHVLSAIHGLGIDNIFVDVSTMEIPIVDGSALPFAELLDSAGTLVQEQPREYIRLQRPIRVEAEGKWIEAEPCDSLKIHYSIEFNHPLIGYQERSYQLDPCSYRNEICPARTFGFYEELDGLKKAGLIRGGSLENAVVLSSTGLLNPSLRFEDEFVRHKILDLVGDIALVGRPLLAKIRAHRAGHALHFSLSNQILRHPDYYEIVSAEPTRRTQNQVAFSTAS
jgi:UDP-3-O-[3-hydroxymyristoyl] N-acetylglucosamine deacetylase